MHKTLISLGAAIAAFALLGNINGCYFGDCDAHICVEEKDPSCDDQETPDAGVDAATTDPYKPDAF